MTREEARKFSYDWGNGDDATVDAIYDAIGSCKECKYLQKEKNNYCLMIDWHQEDDAYCSYFERRNK